MQITAIFAGSQQGRVLTYQDPTMAHSLPRMYKALINISSFFGTIPTTTTFPPNASIWQAWWIVPVLPMASNAYSTPKNSQCQHLFENIKITSIDLEQSHPIPGLLKLVFMEISTAVVRSAPASTAAWTALRPTTTQPMAASFNPDSIRTVLVQHTLSSQHHNLSDKPYPDACPHVLVKHPAPDYGVFWKTRYFCHVVNYFTIHTKTLFPSHIALLGESTELYSTGRPIMQ